MQKQTLAPHRGRKTRQRGMAMALTMLILLSIMAMVLLGMLTNGNPGSSGMMTTADSSIRFAASVDQSVTAINLAEAGVEDTVLWLSAQSAPPANTSEFAPSQSGFTVPLWNATTVVGPPPRSVVQYPDANHTFSVTLYPNSGNVGSNQKGYLIESIGSDNGFTQILHVYVQQTSFGHFSFFENGAGGGTWGDTNHNFDGPVHMNYSSTPITVDWNDNTSPIFNYTGSDAYTTGFKISWNGNGHSSTPPSTATDWASVSAGGANSVHDGQNDIPMPTAGSNQKAAALGTLPVAPVTLGATVCPGGGIYIHGDVQQMTLSVDPADSTSQVIELYQVNPLTQAQNYTKIEISPSGNTTTVQTGTYANNGTITNSPGPATVTSGTTNGVVFCDGNIGGQGSPAAGGLRGTIADNQLGAGNTVLHFSSLTIATDVSNGKNINVDGSLVVNSERQIQQDQYGNYEFRSTSGTTVTSSSSTPTNGDNPIYVPETQDTGPFATKAGRLGLVTNNLVFTQSTYDATGSVAGSAFRSIEVDGIAYANGTLKADNSGGRPSGSLLMMGGNVHSGPQGLSPALYGNYQYDQRLSDSPPPYFPTTSNRYSVLSWQRVTATLQ